ncbi:2,3-diaminopropionate biosynthesis protein SbnA [Burkholderia sp. SRS-W-2-2016]|uniref:2,3-diaminopropionate biosynthesis protein SbnA n=1 Tax=Burkholderia sp. SRS-W-2-2016 TaxID=1926878 RepID=UPI00094B1E30|nr:2,3-diaminopropionate biosynthesis protein SbnA [Burkholderia sp. SRS-W-2-2016]OLL30998.1 2,3-diaminopropionate biosynthesis protein SbnA [Burkholderia sp. SRS-W-2-2016]
MTAISRIVNDRNFVKVEHLGFDALYMKLEAFNAAGSIKMKTALGMVDDLETQGRIGPQTVLIESSSGSLGVALSVICAERGYRFVCVVDPNASPSNVKVMKALGAEVVVVDRRDANGGFLGTRIAYIHDAISRNANYLWLNQYANPQNPRAHFHATAPAIAEAFESIDYLFVGAGTTGTLMGCVEYFTQYRPATKIIAVDAVGSVTFGGNSGPRHIPGLGTSRRPEIFCADGIHALEMVREIDTIAMCRFLARSNGILAGGSTGTVLAGVIAWQDRIPADAVVVAISPDMGERYLDTVYDDEWVASRFGAIPQWSLPLNHSAPSRALA